MYKNKRAPIPLRSPSTTFVRCVCRMKIAQPPKLGRLYATSPTGGRSPRRRSRRIWVPKLLTVGFAPTIHNHPATTHCPPLINKPPHTATNNLALISQSQTLSLLESLLAIATSTVSPTAVMEESAAQLDNALTFETHEDPRLKSVGYVATEDEDKRTVHYEDQEEMDGGHLGLKDVMTGVNDPTEPGTGAVHSILID